MRLPSQQTERSKSKIPKPYCNTSHRRLVYTSRKSKYSIPAKAAIVAVGSALRGKVNHSEVIKVSEKTSPEAVPLKSSPAVHELLLFACLRYQRPHSKCGQFSHRTCLSAIPREAEPDINHNQCYTHEPFIMRISEPLDIIMTEIKNSRQTRIQKLFETQAQHLPIS